MPEPVSASVHALSWTGHHTGRRLRAPKTAELVAAHLRREIVRRNIRPGDSLPTESALMEQFGISRPTLREAFRVLESEALITVHRGVNGGARVAAPDAGVAARYAGLVLEYGGATIGDVRGAACCIEPPSVRQLAARHSGEDILRLREAVAGEKAARGDPPALARAQNAFHALLVELTGSQTLTLLSGMLRDIVDRAGATRTGPDPAAAAPPARSRRAQRAHAKLVDLIEDGRADEAETLWRRHLASADDGAAGVPGATVLELLG